MSDVVSYERQGEIALITVANQPVNALSQAVRQGLLDRVMEAEADEDVRAIVILG